MVYSISRVAMMATVQPGFAKLVAGYLQQFSQIKRSSTGVYLFKLVASGLGYKSLSVEIINLSNCRYGNYGSAKTWFNFARRVQCSVIWSSVCNDDYGWRRYRSWQSPLFLSHSVLLHRLPSYYLCLPTFCSLLSLTLTVFLLFNIFILFYRCIFS